MIDRILAVSLAGSVLGAQSSNADSVCNAADQAVEHVPLAPAGDLQWMRWYTLTGCGMQGARAAAAALRTNELRHEADEARLREFFTLFSGFRANVLLNSFQDAAEDSGATALVRIYAIEAMTGFLSPSATYNRAALTDPNPELRCGSVPRIPFRSGSMNGLPNDVFGRVLNSVTRVANKASATPTVKQLALCWKGILELQVPISTNKIELTYVCGTKFKIHNSNTADVKLQYAVLPGNESGEMTLLGSEDYIFTTIQPGSFQISYNGQVLATKQNTNKVCP